MHSSHPPQECSVRCRGCSCRANKLIVFRTKPEADRWLCDRCVLLEQLALYTFEGNPWFEVAGGTNSLASETEV